MGKWVVIVLVLLCVCGGVGLLGAYAGFEVWRVSAVGDEAPVAGSAEAGGEEAAAIPAIHPGCEAGSVAYARRDFGSAVDQLDECVAAHPSDNARRLLRGKAYAQLERWERSESDLERAVEFFPTDSSAWETLAYVRIRMGNDHSAVAALNRWIELDSTAATAFRMRADARYRIGEVREASEDASRACALGDADGCSLQRRIDEATRKR